MAVHFHFDQIQIPLKNRIKLKNFITGIFSAEGFKLNRLDYIFCTDKKLLKINKEFLHHNTYTDIVTFDLSEDESITGEIYISGERIHENAEKFGVTFEEELHRVIFHGALHLCGYKDKKAEEKTLMRKKENDYLKRYFNKENDKENH
jgi:rRNA maturation RNase YbeY